MFRDDAAHRRALGARRVRSNGWSRKVSRLSIGPGIDDPDVGPLASAAQLARVEDYVGLASSEGATVATGVPLPPGLKGYFIMPTVLVDVENSMRVAQDEIFGPVQSVLRFDDEAEAVAIANDSRYGLAAGVFTRDLATAHRVAGALEAGQVQINRYPAGGVDTPFGGYKQSGLGREKGIEAIRYYTQLKTVIVALDGD